MASRRRRRPHRRPHSPHLLLYLENSPLRYLHRLHQIPLQIPNQIPR